MKQNEKDLLLKDLSARLPYGVKVQTTYINPQTKERKDIGTDVLSTIEISLLIDGYYELKPYLFPLESMTEEQKEEYYGTFSLSGDISGSVDFYNKHHLDWRGLIPMGLAIDAAGKNIY